MANSQKKNQMGMNSTALLKALQRIYNACLYQAVLAIGTGSAAKVKITTGATGAYMIEGKLYTSPASQEVAFTATTHDIIANASTVQERQYAVCLDAAGTGYLVAGDQADTGKSVAPDVSDLYCVLGIVKLQVAAGTTNFDASTDLLSAGHITDTYTDMGILVY